MDNENETGALAPLCVACAYHGHRERWIKGMSDHECRHPALASVVDGRREGCCEAARMGRGACGTEGRLFLQRPAVEGDGNVLQSAA